MDRIYTRQCCFVLDSWYVVFGCRLVPVRSAAGGGHEGLPKAIGGGLVCRQKSGERGMMGLLGEGQEVVM